MARNLAPDRPRATMAVAGALVTLAVPSSLGQIAAIVLGGVVGLRLLQRPDAMPEASATPDTGIHRGFASVLLASFLALLVVLPPLALATGSHAVGVIAAFYNAGALVFGGGHVMLPLLQASVVTPGWDRSGEHSWAPSSTARCCRSESRSFPDSRSFRFSR